MDKNTFIKKFKQSIKEHVDISFGVGVDVMINTTEYRVNQSMVVLNVIRHMKYKKISVDMLANKIGVCSIDLNRFLRGNYTNRKKSDLISSKLKKYLLNA